MDEATFTFLQHKVANALMKAHGYDRRNEAQIVEFNPNNKDSQFSMLLDDAEVAVATTLDILMELSPEDEHTHDHDHEHSEPLLGVVEPPTVQAPSPQNPNITIQNTKFIFLDAKEGVATTVKDVKDWLFEVEAAGIPEDVEIDGYLHLGHDTHPTGFDRIECAECGTQMDTVMLEHFCRHHYPEPTLF